MTPREAASLQSPGWCHRETYSPPDVLSSIPATLSFWAGVVVPMPTLPALVMRIHSCSVPLLVANLITFPLVSEEKKNPCESWPSRPLLDVPVTVTSCVPVPFNSSPALLPATLTPGKPLTSACVIRELSMLQAVVNSAIELTAAVPSLVMAVQATAG